MPLSGCRKTTKSNEGPPRANIAMNELNPVIPGFYADKEGRLYLNMGEFLAVHGLPDNPGLRAVVWDDIREIFQMEVIEIAG